MRDLRSALLKALSLPQQAFCGGLETNNVETSLPQTHSCLNCNGEQMVCRRCEALFCRWCDFEGLARKYGVLCSGCEVLCREERRAAKGGSDYVDDVAVPGDLLREGPSPVEAKLSKARKVYEKKRIGRAGSSLRRTGRGPDRDDDEPSPPARRKSTTARALDEGGDEGTAVRGEADTAANRGTRREEAETIAGTTLGLSQHDVGVSQVGRAARAPTSHALPQARQGRCLIDSPKARSPPHDKATTINSASNSPSNSSNLSMANTPKVRRDTSRADAVVPPRIPSNTTTTREGLETSRSEFGML